MIKKFIFILLFLAFVSNNIFAMIPFKNQLAQANKFFIDCNFNYTPIYQIIENQELINLDLALKYGLTNDFEARLSLGYFWDTKTSDNIASEQGLTNLKLAFAYKIKNEDNLPGLIGFLETMIIDKKRNIQNITEENIYFNNFHVGTTFYSTNDPIITYLKLGYIVNIEKQIKNILLKEADLFYIQPNIDFIVNPDIILFGGFTINKLGKSHLNSKLENIDRSELLINFGCKYSINKDIKLYTQIDLGIISTFTLNINYNL